MFCYPRVGKISNKDERNKYKELDYYSNNKFHNIEDTTLMTGKQNESGNNIKPNKIIKAIKWDSYENDGEFTINWLGHSSLLIQMSYQNIPIDPILTNYAAPFNFIGIKRFSEVPINSENILDIDILLISYDHYDHLDYQTIKKIDSKVKNYIVPLGVDSYLLSFGVNKEKIHTLKWWESITINDIDYTLTPSRHYSGRNPLYSNATLWGGYYFTNKKNSIYYTDDSEYTETFKEINKNCGDVDVLLADTGQYNNAWSSIHMNPYEALKAANGVNAKYYISVHIGTFTLSNHNWYDPLEITTENKSEYNVNLITPEIGEKVYYKNISNYSSE